MIDEIVPTFDGRIFFIFSYSKNLCQKSIQFEIGLFAGGYGHLEDSAIKLSRFKFSAAKIERDEVETFLLGENQCKVFWDVTI